MLNYCDFIQNFVFTTNHHLKWSAVLDFCVSLRSGGSEVDETLDYQSRDRNFDPSLLQSFR